MLTRKPSVTKLHREREQQLEARAQFDRKDTASECVPNAVCQRHAG